jgi:hypothetical protein
MTHGRANGTELLDTFEAEDDSQEGAVKGVSKTMINEPTARSC